MFRQNLLVQNPGVEKQACVPVKHLTNIYTSGSLCVYIICIYIYTYNDICVYMCCEGLFRAPAFVRRLWMGQQQQKQQC